MKLNKEKIESLIDDMIDFLVKEMGQDPNTMLNKFANINKRDLLNYLMLMNATSELGDYFLSLQDRLLSNENETKKISKLTYKNSVAYCDYDIFNVDADMVVYFSTDLFAENFTPNIDNLMILKAGVQLAHDHYLQYKQSGYTLNYKQPYITEAYNLPSEYIAKVVVKNSVQNNNQKSLNITNDVDNNLVEADNKTFDAETNKNLAAAIISIYNFAQENDLDTIFFDCTNIEIDQTIILKYKPKNVKIIIKK